MLNVGEAEDAVPPVRPLDEAALREAAVAVVDAPPTVVVRAVRDERDRGRGRSSFSVNMMICYTF